MKFSSKAAEEDWKYPLPERANAEGYLAVGSQPGHRIYWHEYGNRQGEPVLFVHGGPGGATTPAAARFFDPARYRIVLYDQRGCGKSTPNAALDPMAALKDNTTWDLIEDIEALRKHLQMESPIHLFGGSWGSTLALAYAINHPECIKTLILRGIYLCRREDNDYLYQGNAAHYHQDPYDPRTPGTYQIYPEAWKKFVEVIPVDKRHDMIAAYARIFAMTPETEEEREMQDEAAFAWSVWEGSTSCLAQDMSNLGSFAEPEFAKAFARIENHYFLNGVFFTGAGEAARDNNYLLENAHKIAHLPIHIVQGHYDFVCPRFQADALVAELRKHGADVNYMLTQAGHSGHERETMRALVRIMDDLPQQPRPSF